MKVNLETGICDYVRVERMFFFSMSITNIDMTKYLLKVLYRTLDKIAYYRLEIKEISVMVPGAVPPHVRYFKVLYLTLDDKVAQYLILCGPGKIMHHSECSETHLQEGLEDAKSA